MIDQRETLKSTRQPKIQRRRNSGGNYEPNHPIAYFAWRAVSVPDGFRGAEWLAVSGRTVAPGCGSIGG